MKKFLLFFFASLLFLTSCTKESPEPLYDPMANEGGERVLVSREQEGHLYYDLYSDKTCHIADFDDSFTGKSLTVPAHYREYTVTVIEKECFEGASFSHLVLPDTLVAIGDKAFRRCPIQSLVLPDSLKTIGAEAFDNCLSLEEVTFGNALSVIGTGAFYGCNQIRKLMLPESLVSIGEEAFASLSALEEVFLPQGLRTVGAFAFWNSGTPSLSFAIPETVEEIGVSAFEKTHWLEENREEWLIVGNGVLLQYRGSASEVTLPETVRCLSNAFDASPAERITLPETLLKIVPGALKQIRDKDIRYEGTNEEILREVNGDAA